MKKFALLLFVSLCLALTGCAAKQAPVVTPVPTAVPTPAPVSDWRAGLEKMPFSVNGKEQDVFLIVEDKGVAFYADGADKRVVAFCAFPSMEGERGAYVNCDLMDYNEDGMTDPTVNFEHACLMWLSEGGDLIFNPEFSTLPGNAGGKGEE